VVLVVAVSAVLWLKSRETRPPEEALSVASILAGADTAGFARAIAPREFVWPRDHGPHPEFKNEWWYYTGNLVSGGGERYGFQLTFFRSALAPETPDGESRWRTNQVFMVHFGLTDISGGRFHAFERFGRAAKGLAGARAEPFRVWLDDWRAEARGGRPDDDVPVMRLFARETGVAIDLRVINEKPPGLQGVDGLSRKGKQPGNASYYYSLTRMRAEGTVWLPGREVPVTGGVWMDREWSTSALEEGQVGWDWFSLQLSDNTELMYYRLRRGDGSIDPANRGSFVDARGVKTDLASNDIRMDVLDRWDSPRGGEYPSGWRLNIEREGLELNVAPVLADQELDLSFRYWEGAVRVSGTRAGNPVTGFGYVELTGYSE